MVKIVAEKIMHQIVDRYKHNLLGCYTNNTSKHPYDKNVNFSIFININIMQPPKGTRNNNIKY